MLLILVAAVGLGWVTNRARRQVAALEAVQRYGGSVHFDYELVNGAFVGGREPAAPHWLRRTVGDEYFREIAAVSLVYDDMTGKRFANANVGPGLLPYLEGMSDLKRLLLQSTQATDEGLRHIRRVTSLEDLYIWEATEITDDGVFQLRDLTKLKSLYLDHSQMTDQGFLALKRLRKLEHLTLEAHPFSDRGLAAVDGMPSLTWLSVGGERKVPSQITDAGLAHIEHLENLENLDLSYSQVTDAGLASIQRLKKLTHLSLPGCPITDEGLGMLAGLRNLQYLVLTDTQITDDGLKIVEALPRLKLIAVQGTRVTQKAQAKLRRARPGLKVF